MFEFLAFLVSAVTDSWGQAGQRRTWWILGAIVVLIIVAWAVLGRRAA
ncbi:hypothetical protein [Luteibacter sp. dw_328]|nr:hypothetical protein [Luteibacter sp. dw_328]